MTIDKAGLEILLTEGVNKPILVKTGDTLSISHARSRRISVEHHYPTIEMIVTDATPEAPSGLKELMTTLNNRVRKP